MPRYAAMPPLPLLDTFCKFSLVVERNHFFNTVIGPIHTVLHAQLQSLVCLWKTSILFLKAHQTHLGLGCRGEIMNFKTSRYKHTNINLTTDTEK